MDEKVTHPSNLWDKTAVPEARRSGAEALDAYIDFHIRLAIETRYYERINALGSFLEILKDQSFLANPDGHPALFADHGVAHARDVARQILQVLDAVHGRLIPPRCASRFLWMKAYGVLVALLHDIGMVDASPMGRAMHPEYATQEILDPGFDGIFADLWEADCGGIATRIVGLKESGAIRDEPAGVVLRQMLSMANCHSKRKVPVTLLNDTRRLRQTNADRGDI